MGTEQIAPGTTVTVTHDLGEETGTVVSVSNAAPGESRVYTIRFPDDTQSSWGEHRVREAGAAVNTMVHLMYRDACNYKLFGTVVFAGEPTPELRERFTNALDDGSLVPEKVGLVHLATMDALFSLRYPDPDDDHPFHEVTDVVSTLKDPADKRTFAQFVDECEKAEWHT